MAGAPAATPYLRFSDLAGAPVHGLGGRRVGSLADLAVRLDDAFPSVEMVLVRPGRRGVPVAVAVEHVTELAPGRTVLDTPLPVVGADTDGLVLLGRDVLDVQIVDTVNRRLARVGEVDLAWDEGVLRVIAVDVGWRAILRRLGLRRLARRASNDAIDWAGVHLTSGPGHPLQLASVAAAVHRLDPAELAELLVRLPTARGSEVLSTIEGARAAATLAAVHPELGADLIEVLEPGRALSLLGQMPDEKAADALREAHEERRASLLAAVDDARAQRLRAAIGRPGEPVAGEPRAPRRYWHVLRGHAGFWR